MTSTITLEVSPAVAARIQESDEARLAAQRALDNLFHDETQTLTPVRPSDLSPEDIAAIQEGIADADAGCVHKAETVFAELRQITGRTQ